MGEIENEIMRAVVERDSVPPDFVAPYGDELPPHPQVPFTASPALSKIPLPKQLSLVEAYKATVYFVEQYLSLESLPSEDFILFYQYMISDPATGSDFADAIRRAITNPSEVQRPNSP